jgi:hypothetical protein
VKAIRTAARLLGFLVAGCLFDGKETLGLPCTSDDQCGIGVECLGGACGGADACIAGQPLCVDALRLQTCANGSPVTQHCDDTCATFGLAEAVACDYSPQSGQYGCFCDESSSFCDADGLIECWADDDLRSCEGGVWQNVDCDGLCASPPPLGSGTGCGPGMDGQNVCFCSGEFCIDGAQYCIDGDTQAYCLGGAWTQVDCRDPDCESGVSLGCGFLAAIGDETCLCAAP